MVGFFFADPGSPLLAALLILKLVFYMQIHPWIAFLLGVFCSLLYLCIVDLFIYVAHFSRPYSICQIIFFVNTTIKYEQLVKT
jgi:hypothetical protein